MPRSPGSTPLRSVALGIVAAAAALPTAALGTGGVLVTTKATGADQAVMWTNLGPSGALAQGVPDALAAPRTGMRSQPTITPDGRTALMVEGQHVLAFNRDPTTGTLSTVPVDTRPLTYMSNVPVAALAPDGRTLYVATSDASYHGAIDVIAVGADGSLAAPVSMQFDGAIQDMVVSPDGRSLYTLPQSITFASGNAELRQFDIGAAGALTPKAPATISTGGTLMDGAVFTGGGTRLVAFAGTATGTATVTFGVDPSSGRLTPPAAFPTSNSLPPTVSRVVPDGSFIAVTNQSSVFTVPVDTSGDVGAPTTSVAVFGPSGGYWFRWVTGLDISPDGRWAYATGDIYSIGPAPVALPGIASFPITAAGPGTPVQSDFPLIAYTGLVTAPARPSVAALAVPPALAGTPVTLDAAGSTSPDAAISQYAFEFGDGTAATSASPTVTHVYAAPGTYPARVTVTNAAGCSTASRFNGHQNSCTGSPAATATAQVTVTQAFTPPTADSSADGGAAAAPTRTSTDAQGPKVCAGATTRTVSLRRGREFTPAAAAARSCSAGTVRLALAGKASRKACKVTSAGAVRAVRKGTCRVTVTTSVAGRPVTETVVIRVK